MRHHHEISPRDSWNYILTNEAPPRNLCGITSWPYQHYVSPTNIILINKPTFSDWFLKNNQIINLNCHVPSILILIPSFDNKHTINVSLYRAWCICPISKKGKRRMSLTWYHGYGYYDTRTCPINIRVSKIPVPVGTRYPFLIFIFYILRVLSTDIRGYGYFWHPYAYTSKQHNKAFYTFIVAHKPYKYETKLKIGRFTESMKDPSFPYLDKG